MLDAATMAGLGNASVSASGAAPVATDAGGAFLVSGAGLSDPLDVVVTLPGFVERHTTLRGAGDRSVTLIGAGFDLRAFDEMFRAPQLMRWTDAPPLVIEATPMRFTSFNDTTFVASGAAMPDSEFTGLVADTTWALPQMTGDTFTAFASVTRDVQPEGAPVSLLRSGAITIGTFDGLYAATGYWGYGRALVRSDGVVVGGMVMLDKDKDRSSHPMRRAMRVHELGHALGYNHVASRTSVMNAVVTTEPTSWDRDACRLAFPRPPGNRSPDLDPSSAISTSAFRAPEWTAGQPGAPATSRPSRGW